MTSDIVIPNLSDPTVYRDYSRILLRDWVSITNPHEFVLLLFIFDRTIGWGKEWECISWDQFMNGVHSEDGRCYNRGTKMARATLAKMLKSLQTDGFVLTKPGHSGANRYALAFDRKHSDDDMIRISKKNSADSDSAPGPKFRVSRKGSSAQVGDSGDKTSIPPIQRRDEYPPKSTTETAARSITETYKSTTETRGSISGTLRDSEFKEVTRSKETDVNLNHSDSGVLLSGILKKSELSAESKIAQILADPDPSKEDLGHLYHMSWRAYFESAPYVMPKDKDLIAFCAYKKRFQQNPAHADTPFPQFIRWCIQYWGMVMSESFSWMTNYPKLPSVMFLIKNSEVFERTFSRRDYLLAIIRLPRRDRMIHDLVQQGMPVELATERIDEQLKPKVVPPPIQRISPVRQVAPPYVPPVREIICEPHEFDYERFMRL